MELYNAKRQAGKLWVAIFIVFRISVARGGEGGSSLISQSLLLARRI